MEWLYLSLCWKLWLSVHTCTWCMKPVCLVWFFGGYLNTPRRFLLLKCHSWRCHVNAAWSHVHLSWFGVSPNLSLLRAWPGEKVSGLESRWRRRCCCSPAWSIVPPSLMNTRESLESERKTFLVLLSYRISSHGQNAVQVYTCLWSDAFSFNTRFQSLTIML